MTIMTMRFLGSAHSGRALSLDVNFVVAQLPVQKLIPIPDAVVIGDALGDSHCDFILHLSDWL